MIASEVFVQYNQAVFCVFIFCECGVFVEKYCVVRHSETVNALLEVSYHEEVAAV